MTRTTACRYLLLQLCFSLAASAFAPGEALGTAPQAAGRPKIGLALSGGGARGAAHIGVIEVLEKYRVPVDYIAGTSMGALVGGLYASGMSIRDIESLVSRMDWEDAFSDRIRREDRSFRRKRDDDLYLIKHKPGFSGGAVKLPRGILDGQKIDLLLKRYTLPVAAVQDFDDLQIPFRAIATDLATGEMIVLYQGDLALAMRASMAIPALFAPREIDNRLLIDGGLSCNLPIDVVRDMGADVVIAVDIGTHLQKREELQSVLSITDQVTTIMTRRNADLQIDSLTSKDILIQPELGDITTASFDRAARAIPIGVRSALAAHTELLQLTVSKEEYRTRMAGRTNRIPEPVIDEVRIVNQSRLSDDVVTAMIGAEAGHPLDIEQLEKDLNQLYGLELFESVYYDIAEEAGRNVLTITVRERSWGPNYLQFGVAVFEDFEGPNFNLAAAYTRTAVDRLNGEWRIGFQVGQEPALFSEFFQPIDHKLRFFFHLQAFAQERTDNVFDSDGRKLSELGIRRIGAGAAAGRELGTWGDVRIGIMREAGEINMQVGDPGVPDAGFDTGEAFLQFSVDEMDNVNFPHTGGNLRIRIASGLEELGSDAEYEQGVMEGSYAYTLGDYTGLIGGLFGTTRDCDAPYQSLFRLGGFAGLSGLEQNELRGQHAALLSGVFFRRIADFKVASLYGGLSVEYGNVFQRMNDISFSNGIASESAFVGLDTILGPVYLGYGLAEGGRRNLYFILGRPLNFR
ncbi:MAG: patatin-like phospholipase family protein [Chitinivibrionia bacterium]|nr:patatin-like phospholipase family protein [Chitinivibrionia bacterium]